MDAFAQAKESCHKSATEILVECMEAFGTYEPDRIMLVYTDTEGGLTLKGNVRRCEAVGMLEVAKHAILKNDGE